MDSSQLSSTDIIWLVIGFSGQLLFAMRFLLQWLCSERQRKSVIPISFWYFSIVGGLVLLAYAIHKLDPVFISGQLFGVFIYCRNLYFIHKERNGDEKTVLAQERT